METAPPHMERMIPELKDLEQKKIFSKSEICAIVTQRNIHEVSVIRTSSPNSYLCYIEYEINLEKLRKLGLPESIELWVSYINYSLTKFSTKLFSQVLLAAIASHPGQLRFWIMSIQIEAFGNESSKGGRNIDGAKKALMRSLSFFNSTNLITHLLEWIRVELNFLKVIEGQRDALGIETFEGVKTAKT
ncbi:U3 small nucleolar RNA-associated protein 6-domain-containing protein [Phakopsora pachyrhizi]|uniref:U3 small nucleolar RNA-associated protein 6-domain-containing protein n=1 Tax=Phakopsora pachyrhizi TaxID=170000 RepID=A0AAV0AUP6_PHAPC|nr:U3 small nucleolar RNA-associated protein 6-domain-containing protein [Phakopsora pachyrhizi]CAH7671730.1 U3 small nucleolar RNA-associated protein 6-domain-containing protein [Phakopsora pachyrhizi]